MGGSDASVAVVGGGVIGLCTAYALSRRGATVTVIDRDRCGAAASWGNAGWVTPGLAAPVPAPGVVRQALRWMLDPESPFLVRPRLDPAFLAWGVRFWRASGAARHKAGLRATLDLARPTNELFDALEADGVDFEMHRDGLLYLVRSPEAVDAWRTMYDELAALGFDGQVEMLDQEAVRALEPGLADGVCAGLLARVERHVRPESLIGGLRRALIGRGVRIEESAEVTGLLDTPDGWRVMTAHGAIDADRVVVAAGVWTRELLAPLGLRLPLEGAKGYSITAPANGDRPRHPLYLTEIKVGVSPFEGAIRLAGTLELAGLNLDVDHRRVAAIVRHAADYIGVRGEGGSVEWAGLRPMAADGLPVIGAVPGHRGLFTATGHHMLGITLGPATGEALAPLVLEDRLVDVLKPLSPARFA
jgi:D-amino-acid dehydrogenase